MFRIVALLAELHDGPLLRKYSAIYFDVNVATPAFLLLISVPTLSLFISFCFQQFCTNPFKTEIVTHI